MAAVREATRVFLHASPGSFQSEYDRQRICEQPEWTVLCGSTAEESRLILASKFLDGAIIFIDADPALGWSLVWEYIERFPRTPVIAVTDNVESDELVRAASRGVTAWRSASIAGSAHYLLKHRLHAGVYHRVCRLLLEHDLPIRQFQCLLLAAAEAAHKDIADRLGIEVATVRSHLQHAVRTAGGTTVEEFLARIRSEAREEAKKGPQPPRGS